MVRVLAVKTYVDNPKNRELGRVGQPYGSSSGCLPTDTNSSVKTYVDNPKNIIHSSYWLSLEMPRSWVNGGFPAIRLSYSAKFSISCIVDIE